MKNDVLRKVPNFIELIFLIIVAMLSTLIIAAPYIITTLQLPKVEEFYYSIIPLLLLKKSMNQGFNEDWNHLLSLGTPWPTPQLMNDSPLSFLLGFLDLYTALAVFILLHVFVQAISVWFLCRELNFKKSTAYITTISILLTTPTEYLLTSDALAVYLVWSLLPTVILVTYKLLSAEFLKRALLWANIYCFLLIYIISNGHLGTFSTYIICIPIIIMFSKNKLNKKIAYCFITFFLTLIPNIAKLHYYLSEYLLYGPDVSRAHAFYNSNAFFSVWAILFKPIPLINPFSLSLQEFITEFGTINSETRVVSFGSPIVLFTIIHGLIKMRNNTSLSPRTKNLELLKILWLILGISFILQFIPTNFLGDAVSSNWTFKDPVILSGILIFGFYLNKLNLQNKLILLSMHIPLILASSLTLTLGPSIYSKINESSEFHTPRQVAEVTNTDTRLSAIKILKSDSRCTIKPCVKSQPRVIYTGAALELLYKEKLLLAGLLPNSLSLHDFTDVSASLKGISLDSVHPSQRKFYGMVAAESFRDFSYFPNEEDWIKSNGPMRNILGINYIIAKSTDIFKGTGLIKIGEFKSEGSDVDDMVIMKNSMALERVLLLNNQDIFRYVKSNNCKNDLYFTCLNVDELYNQIENSSNLKITRIDNGVQVNMNSSVNKKTLIITEMWRPQWSTNIGEVFNFHGLIGVQVPAYTENILIRFQQDRNGLLENLHKLVMFLNIVFLLTYITRVIKYSNSFVNQTSKYI
jgi:hypothetical protein